MSSIIKGLNESRSDWDSNMPGYQGDYGGAENWDSGRRSFKRQEAEQEWKYEQDFLRQQEEKAQRIAQYNQTGDFWLKKKDTQEIISDVFVGKAAANAAAVELLQQQPELKGNLVITAQNPNKGVTEGEADYGADYQDKVKRLGQMAKQGERKTVWDPVKRVYKTVPVNPPKEQGVAEGWKEKVGAAALAGAMATGAGAKTPKVPLHHAIDDATIVYNNNKFIRKEIKKYKEKQDEKRKAADKQVKNEGVAEADLNRRGFLKGAGAAALGAMGGNTMAKGGSGGGGHGGGGGHASASHGSSAGHGTAGAHASTAPHSTFRPGSSFVPHGTAGSPRGDGSVANDADKQEYIKFLSSYADAIRAGKMTPQMRSWLNSHPEVIEDLKRGKYGLTMGQLNADLVDLESRKNYHLMREEGVDEAYDKWGWHTSLTNGEFMPTKYGTKEYVYLHDLDNQSANGNPQLVTVNKPTVAKRIAKQFGGKVVKTNLNTYRIVKPAVEGVEEAYQFKGPFPFDVDHMHGGRGINLPKAETKKYFTDKKQWERAVNDINSSKYDDNSDYIGVTGRSTVEINGREWARWSDAQQKGYIELSSMSEQGVAEGSRDQVDPNTVWEVSFDYGPHQSEKVKVRASSQEEAEQKGMRAAKKLGHRFPQLNWAMPAEQDIEEEKQRLDPSCWKGYKKQGTKMKGDTRVNNCVPVKESAILKGLK